MPLLHGFFLHTVLERRFVDEERGVARGRDETRTRASVTRIHHRPSSLADELGAVRVRAVMHGYGDDFVQI